MRTSTSWLLGALVGLLVLAALFFFVVLFTYDSAEPVSPVFALVFLASFGLLVGLLAVLAIVCIKHVKTNERVSTHARGWWVAALLVGGVIAIPHYWWTYLRPGAREHSVDPFSPVRDSRTVTVVVPVREAHQALRTTIENTPGWRIVSETENALRIRVRRSWRSWGEDISVWIDDRDGTCTVTATTRPVLRTTVIDFGRGQRHLNTICRAVTDHRQSR